MQRYWLEEIRPMFRQTYAAAFVPLAALVSFTVATAQEPKAVGGTKLITNSIGTEFR
jgi:hypothetical protein